MSKVGDLVSLTKSKLNPKRQKGNKEKIHYWCLTIVRWFFGLFFLIISIYTFTDKEFPIGWLFLLAFSVPLLLPKINSFFIRAGIALAGMCFTVFIEGLVERSLADLLIGLFVGLFFLLISFAALRERKQAEERAKKEKEERKRQKIKQKQLEEQKEQLRKEREQMQKKAEEQQKKREAAYRRFCQRQKAKGLVKHGGYWWKPEELEARKRFDKYWVEKERRQDVKGDWMYCRSCHFEWKIRKERGLPARCMRCNSTNIILNKEYSHQGKKGYPETKDKADICPHCSEKIKPDDEYCPSCGEGLGKLSVVDKNS